MHFQLGREALVDKQSWIIIFEASTVFQEEKIGRQLNEFPIKPSYKEPTDVYRGRWILWLAEVGATDDTFSITPGAFHNHHGTFMVITLHEQIDSFFDKFDCDWLLRQPTKNIKKFHFAYPSLFLEASKMDASTDWIEYVIKLMQKSWKIVIFL